MKNDNIETFLAKVRERIYSQYEYDCTKNVDAGILSEHDARTGLHAINLGLVSAIGAYVEWDLHAAIEFAADILEDVNAHSEAAELRAKIGA